MMQELTRIELVHGLSDFESCIHSIHILENPILNRVFYAFNKGSGYYPHPSKIVRLRKTINAHQFAENVEEQFDKLEILLRDAGFDLGIESEIQFWRINFRGVGIVYTITNRIKLPQKDTGVELFHCACRINSPHIAFLTWTNTYVPLEDLVEEISLNLDAGEIN